MDSTRSEEDTVTVRFGVIYSNFHVTFNSACPYRSPFINAERSVLTALEKTL